MITYNWNCKTVDVHPQDEDKTNVVYNVHWIVTGVQGEYSVNNIGTQVVKLSEGGTFIPFEDLTNEIEIKTLKLIKLGGYVCNKINSQTNILESTEKIIKRVINFDFEELLKSQAKSWKKIWEVSDIVIVGDPKSQQAIRFNIFQLKISSCYGSCFIKKYVLNISKLF